MDFVDYKSFAVGAGCVLGVLGINFFRRLLWYPGEAQLEAAARKQLPHMGDDSKVTLWGFEAAGEHYGCGYGVPDASPYVCRVEAYLRLVGVPYLTRSLALKEAARTPAARYPLQTCVV